VSHQTKSNITVKMINPVVIVRLPKMYAGWSSKIPSPSMTRNPPFRYVAESTSFDRLAYEPPSVC
jgi:hypothetical protein